MTMGELLFIPTPGIGHLVSTLEFAKRLVDRDDRLLVTVLVMKAAFAAPVDAYTKPLATPQSRIRFIHLPEVAPPSQDAWKSPEGFIYALIESQKPHVKDVIRNIVSSRSKLGSARVAGLVLDFFCMPLIDVANEHGLPSYQFLTSNVAFLALMLFLSTRHAQTGRVLKHSDPELVIPGFVNPVPPNVLPSAVFNTYGGYTAYIKLAQRFRETKGIIVNTFAELEDYAVNTISDCQTPPIYTVGPVLDLKGHPHPEADQAQNNKIMEWLEDQPEASVVFLCFGSMGTFQEPQVKEIALALEHSGYRFLWSLRMRSTKESSIMVEDHISMEGLFPEGFLERVKGRSMICGWTPQVEILAHRAVGGFVSHCGWNSILESLWHSVPIATWPLYAEQQLNAYKMVKELGLAVEIRLDYRLGGEAVVMADEIESAVRILMDGHCEVRKKVKEMGETARNAVMDGGSSFVSVGQLIEDMVGGDSV